MTTSTSASIPKSIGGAGARAMIKIFQGLIDAASRVTPEIKARFADEAVCRRCGKCCYSATRVKDRMVMLKDLPCKYLTAGPDGSFTCSVYAERESTGWCHRITTESVRKELFPPSCPYMDGVAGYKGKVELGEDEFKEIIPILREIFKLFDKPDYIRASDWDRFIHQTLGL